jgi:DnaK suppressor protein
MGKFDGLKVTLEKRRIELSERLERLKKDLSRGHSSDSAEQAQERENDEVLTQLSTDVEGELREVNTALDRLQSNQYGVCVSCSAEIPLARLQIKPEAVRCVKCA